MALSKRLFFSFSSLVESTQPLRNGIFSVPLERALVPTESEETDSLKETAIATVPPPAEDTEEAPFICDEPTRPNLPLVRQPDPLPLYLRNPGPPPGVPRQQELKATGRLSYRVRKIEQGRTFSLNPWLVILLGVGVLGLVVLSRTISPGGSPVVASEVSTAGFIEQDWAASAHVTPVISRVEEGESYALVMVPGGLVLEEPQTGALPVQKLSQYTYVAFQRKISTGWYQLKGGSGWINAAAVQTYASEKAAWDAKRSFEAKS